MQMEKETSSVLTALSFALPVMVGAGHGVPTCSRICNPTFVRTQIAKRPSSYSVVEEQHLDSFPENQLDTIAKAGETSTVETRNRCPICFLSVDADGMGDFANHVANHLERFAAFALPNSSEENEDGASSVASRGRTGSTASQDVSGMSLPSDVSDEQERAPPIHIKQREAKEEPFVYNPNSRELTKIQLIKLAKMITRTRTRTRKMIKSAPQLTSRNTSFA